MTSLLTAAGVSFEVGRARLLDDVSFEAERGELLAVVGPNGAGKSTLLRVLAGETAPSSGEVRIEDRPIAGMPAIEQARLRAVLPQQTPSTFRFTAREVVGFGRVPWLSTPQSIEDDEAVEDAMRLTEVTSMAAQAFPTLSGGEQTLVSLARVLAQRTPLLLLDEPTSALDLRHQALVMDLLYDLAASGTAVVAVLHDLNLAATHAARVLLLDRGRVAACGPSREVLQPSLLSDVFEHPVRVIEDPVEGNPLVLAERRVRTRAG